MLKSIRLQNFFGFQDCMIDLEKSENVLVGVNGSGKSNFLKAIKVLQEGLHYRSLKGLINQEWGGIEQVINKAREGDLFQIHFLFSPLQDIGDFVYTLIFTKTDNFNYTFSEFLSKKIDGKDSHILTAIQSVGAIRSVEKEGIDASFRRFETESSELFLSSNFEINAYPEILRSQDFLEKIFVYDAFDTSEVSLIRRATMSSFEIRLVEDGSNLSDLLNLLKLNHRDSFAKIVDSLKGLNQGIEDIDFRYIGGRIELHLIEKNLKSSISSLHISDGTLKFLCLLSIFYNPNRGNVICIDEPELGLHPDMINTLADAIKFASETSQIIVSTHSPLLLNAFELKNIIVFEKNDSNATIVKKLDEKDYKFWLDEYLPGEMWRAGAIGGNRW